MKDLAGGEGTKQLGSRDRIEKLSDATTEIARWAVSTPFGEHPFKVLDQTVPSNYRIGRSSSSYLNMTFAPASFGTSFSVPNPCIGKKDQDFALGPVVTISVHGNDPTVALSEEVLLPVVAIELSVGGGHLLRRARGLLLADLSRVDAVLREAREIARAGTPVLVNALIGVYWLKDPQPKTRAATLTLAGCMLAMA